MIDIFRCATYDSPLNVFYGRDSIHPSEVQIKEKRVINSMSDDFHTYAEPNKPGMYAFGGTFLYTSNGVYQQFSKRPVPLHDRDMSKDKP